jgi:hypothetical protein
MKAETPRSLLLPPNQRNMLAFRNHLLPITVKEPCAMPNTNDAVQNGLIREIQDSTVWCSWQINTKPYVVTHLEKCADR